MLPQLQRLRPLPWLDSARDDVTLRRGTVRTGAEALLEELESLPKQRHARVLVEQPEEVRVRARVDPESGLHIDATLPHLLGHGGQPGRVERCRGGGVDGEVERGGGVEPDVDRRLGGAVEHVDAEGERGDQVRGELPLYAPGRVYGQVELCKSPASVLWYQRFKLSLSLLVEAT